MAISITSSNPARQRRNITKVIPQTNTGASPRGSTYYKTLMACPREWALKYVVGLRPEVTSEALTVGLAWHLMLEVYYTAFSKGLDIKAAMAAAYDSIEPLQYEDGYQDIYSMLVRMWDSYITLYEEDDQTWDVLSVEETLIYYGSFTYSARLDLIIQEKGQLWIVEHKSARTITASLLESYQLDLQILGQIWLMKQCVDLMEYDPFAGVKINITTKQSVPKCARIEVCPSSRHLEAFEQSAAAWEVARTYYESLGYPQALGHCSGYARGYGRCEFYDLCHGHPTTSVEEWEQCPENELPSGYIL